MDNLSRSTSWEMNLGTSYPTLTDDIETDVVIAGAGITGIFNAYMLSKAGLRVVVLEKDETILQYATMLTTAFITQIVDSSFTELVTLFGQRKAKLVWESGKDAISLIADIIKKENIDCDFAFVSAYTYAKNAKEFEKLKQEYRSLVSGGFEAKLQADGKDLHFENAGFMEIPGQAKFHPIKFARALAEAAKSAGAKIFTNSEVVAMEGMTLTTKAGRVRAKDIIIATYEPFTNEGTRFKKAMYVSYVYEVEIAKGLIPEGLYLDMHNPYHYFRIDSHDHGDRMIIGGEDHRKDINIGPDKSFAALEKSLQTILGTHGYTIQRKWYGPILESTDGLPFIGKIRPHVFVATGFSGNGMTYSAISSTMIRDAIRGDTNSYTHLYNPKRAPTISQLGRKGFDYIREFFGGALKNFFTSKG